jgi:predicted Fe-S protein YdhL (DUF1289 family)
MDDGSALCRGCLRTLNEIATWASLGNTDKQRVIDAVKVRRDRTGSASA